jgi:hypothetical protein
MNRELTRTVIETLVASLKLRGFRRKGQMFERPVNDVVHLIQVQKSLDGAAGHIKATVNLAVWVPALAQVRAGVPDSPSVPQAPFRERLGFVMNEHRDVWWEMASEKEARVAASAMVGAIEKCGLPFLEQVSSLADLVALWDRGDCPGLTEGQRVMLLKRAREVSSRAAQQGDAADGG